MLKEEPGQVREIQFQPEPRIPFLRLMALNRALGLISLGQLVAIVALVVGILGLFPLKEKEVVIVQLDPANNNRYILEKADEKLRANASLIASMIRTYVNDRESVDKITEAHRYERVQAMSDETVFKAFLNVYSNKEISPLFQEGLKRSILITNDRSLADGIHQVEFTRIDTQERTPSPQVATKWVAVMKYGFADRKGTVEDKLLNPLGLFIIEYSLSKRQE